MKITGQDKKIIRRLGIARLSATVIFVILLFLCIALNAGKLDIYLPEDCRVSDFVPETNIVSVRTAPDSENHMIVIAEGRGKVFIDNLTGNGSSGYEYVNVLPFGVIYDISNGNFSGSQYVTLLVHWYMLSIAILLIASFFVQCRTELFSYTTLFFGGISVFWLGASLAMLISGINYIRSPETYFMMNIYSILSNSGTWFMGLSMPFMLIFAVSLAISNFFLIKHEGRRLPNLLGFILSILIVCGYIGAIVLDRLFWSGSEQQIRIFNTFISVYTTAFVYFECMLVSVIICGLIAAKKKPSYYKTHVIILGCAIAADGTPLPLLRGRIDRAIAFAKEQKEKTGKNIIFVPSGGKGSDEVISEAESMKNYLVSQGIPERNIIVENKSSNTQENMRFSLQKIKNNCENPKIIFSTSNYHVLRSGIIAQNENLAAEGIGCQTKWYFWPNAFIREFVGLLASKWRQHILWMIFFISIFMIINMLIPI